MVIQFWKCKNYNENNLQNYIFCKKLHKIQKLLGNKRVCSSYFFGIRHVEADLKDKDVLTLSCATLTAYCAIELD